MNIKTFTKEQAEKKIILTQHFNTSEFMCEHCHTLIIDIDLINLLEQLRVSINHLPINITSGYRCKINNKAAGGANSSLHLYGRAADFNCNHKINGITVLREAYKIFPRVGFYQSDNSGFCYMHVDNKTDGRSKCWISRRINKKNNYQYFTNIDAMLEVMKQDTKIRWYSLVI
jgi:uncharacterized protein YcbK (DUF882 family)